MSRVVSLYLPTWPTDRLRRAEADFAQQHNDGDSGTGCAVGGEVVSHKGVRGEAVRQPLVLVAREGRKRIVVAADGVASRHGIHPGMAASMAQALVAGLVVIDADPRADAAALDRLGLWLLRRYAPIVAIDPPDGLMIDIEGAAHLHGGEALLLADIVDRLAAVGITSRASVAPTYGGAHALARFKPDATTILWDGDTDILTSLPIAALRLPGAMVDNLRRLGFETIGELSATPRAPLALRFGSDIGRRLDQLFGRSSEPFELIDAPELIRVRQAFAEPIAASETIARYITKLVGLLCLELEARGLGARSSTCCSTVSTT